MYALSEVVDRLLHLILVLNKKGGFLLWDLFVLDIFVQSHTIVGMEFGTCEVLCNPGGINIRYFLRLFF